MLRATLRCLAAVTSVPTQGASFATIATAVREGFHLRKARRVAVGAAHETAIGHHRRAGGAPRGEDKDRPYDPTAAVQARVLTNKKTGEMLTGTLFGSAPRGGKARYRAKTEEGAK